MKHYRGLIVALAIALSVGIAFVALRPREPVYQGKRLGVWVANLSPGNSQEAWLQGGEALRQMGTNALPFLVRMLESSDSRLKLRLMSWLQQQSLVKLHFKPASFRRYCARRALEVLGSSVKPAVPQLVQIAKAREKDVTVRIHALDVLRQLGSDAKETVPALIEILKAADEDIAVKSSACFALGAIGPEGKQAVPALISALGQKGMGSGWANESASLQNGQLLQESASFHMRLFVPAARALGKIGPGAQAAVPALLQALKDEDNDVREEARKALQRIDPATEVPAERTSP